MKKLHLFIFFVLLPVISSAQDVVINKLYNGGTGVIDIVELLVVKNNLNMQGMILRDFAVNTNDSLLRNDFTTGSGYYTFMAIPEWASVKAGTLIVLYANDTGFIKSGDTVIKAGLNNKALFTSIGTFNIGGNDMVMIKRASSNSAGFDGNIHSFSVGLSENNIVTPLPSPLLRSSSSLNATGSTPMIVAANPNRSLNDYNQTGTQYITGQGFSVTLFGLPHNATNRIFVDSLRKLTTNIHHTSPLKFNIYFRENTLIVDSEIELQVRVFDLNGSRCLLATTEAGSNSIPVNIVSGAYFITAVEAKTGTMNHLIKMKE